MKIVAATALAAALLASQSAHSSELSSLAYVNQMDGFASASMSMSQIATPLLQVASAIPAAPRGRGNLSLIWQDGSDNHASVTQTGSRNVGLIRQIGIGNTAAIHQTGSGHRGLIMQQGRNNVAIIRQR